MATATAPVFRGGSQAKLMFFLFFFATTIFVSYLKNARILDPSSPIAQQAAGKNPTARDVGRPEGEKRFLVEHIKSSRVMAE